jgi:hypothetical protein
MKKSLSSAFMILALTGLIITLNSCGPKGKYIGLQLYSLRDSIKKDVPGTIAKVHQMG